MAAHFRKHLFSFLFLFVFADFFVLSVSAGESLIIYQDNRTPAKIGMRLVKNLLNRKDYMLYGNEGLHYAEACTAYSAYRFAALTDDKELTAELNKRYGSIVDQNNLISQKPHVDQSRPACFSTALDIPSTGDVETAG
jgi:unsaturated rhamnogalacturonyl hydrolase